MTAQSKYHIKMDQRIPSALFKASNFYPHGILVDCLKITKTWIHVVLFPHLPKTNNENIKQKLPHVFSECTY